MTRIRLFIHIGLFVVACALLVPGCGKRDAAKDAAAFSAQAEAAFNAHDYGKALRLIGEAITLNEPLGADSAIGENYLLRGRCLRELGDYVLAHESLTKAADRFHVVGQHRLERKGRLALAEFNERIGQYDSALTYALDAAAAARVFNDVPDLFRANRIAADLCRAIGNYDRALQLLDELLQIDSAQFRLRSRSDLLALRLKVCRDAGRYDQAMEAAGRWKEYAVASGDSNSLVAACVAWGRAQQALGHADSAMRTFTSTLDLLTIRTDPGLRAEAISALAALTFRQQSFDNARRLFSDALRSNAQTDNVALRQMIQAMLLACEARSRPGASAPPSPDLAKNCADLLDSAQATGLRAPQMLALSLLARIGLRPGNTDTALSYARRALELYERPGGVPLGDGMPADLFRSFVDGQNETWYEPILQQQANLGRPAGVFEFMERKNLCDLGRYFSRLPMRIHDPQVSRVIAKVQWNIGAFAALERDLFDELAQGKQGGNERYDSLRVMIPRRLSALVPIGHELETVSPNFSWIIQPRTPSLAQVMDSLHAEGALLEYAPVPSGVAILAATHDTAIVRIVSMNRAHLIDLIREYMRLIGDPRLNGSDPRFNVSGAIGRIQELSAILSNILVQPVLPFLGKTTTLYAVLPQEFGWFPLHTLRSGGAPIVVRFHVHYLPTAAALLFAEKQQHTTYDIIGVGHPGRTSWDVEYELKDIRGFYDKARMLFYTAATIGNIDTAKYDLLHFAAEFVLNTTRPWKSVLTLSDGHSPDGRRDVPLGEALEIPPPQALFFSNISPTQGGFFRYAPVAFLAAGTPEVIATMWQGERKAKKYFGEIFYTSLQSGMPADQAYDGATVVLSKSPDYSRPHRWGLFYLFGK